MFSNIIEYVNRRKNMLKLKNITKTYETDGVEDVQALKGI